MRSMSYIQYGTVRYEKNGTALYVLYVCLYKGGFLVHSRYLYANNEINYLYLLMGSDDLSM